jgi:hypothetical protein
MMLAARQAAAANWMTGAGSNDKQIGQCFPGRSDQFGCARSKPSQGSVPADLTLASDLTFVFNTNRVRLECCIDPLRPPRLSGLTEDKRIFSRSSINALVVRRYRPNTCMKRQSAGTIYSELATCLRVKLIYGKSENVDYTRLSRGVCQRYSANGTKWPKKSSVSTSATISGGPKS